MQVYSFFQPKISSVKGIKAWNWSRVSYTELRVWSTIRKKLTSSLSWVTNRTGESGQLGARDRGEVPVSSIAWVGPQFPVSLPVSWTTFLLLMALTLVLTGFIKLAAWQQLPEGGICCCNNARSWRRLLTCVWRLALAADACWASRPVPLWPDTTKTKERDRKI